MELVQRQIRGKPYWVVDEWEEQGMFHGFVGREVDISRSISPWQEVFLSQEQRESVPLLLLRQIHSADIIEFIDQSVSVDVLNQLCAERPEGDGWLANQFGLNRDLQFCMGIKSADCFPVLIFERAKGIVAALHCGWRSAVKEILPKALLRIQDLGGDISQTQVAIGPGAQVCCYEVGDDVTEELKRAKERVCSVYATVEQDAAVVRSRVGKMFGDIRALLEMQLRFFGVHSANVVTSTHCTICRDQFFSFRREKALSGRQVSFVKVPPCKQKM